MAAVWSSSSGIGRKARLIGLALVVVAAACAADGTGSSQPVALVTAGETLSGRYLAARHAERQHDAKPAADFALAALAVSPTDPYLLSRAIAALIADDRVTEAVPLARRALELGQGGAIPSLTLAAENFSTGNFEGALERTRELPGQGGLSVLTPLLQAWAHAGLGQVDAAVALLEPPAGTGAVGLRHLHAAWILELAGRVDLADHHLLAVLEEHPEPWLRLAELGGGQLARAGQHDRALALYEGYIERHPESNILQPLVASLKSGKIPSPDIRTAADGAAEVFFDVAGVLGRQNNRELALLLAQLGLHVRPDFPALQMLVADLLEGVGRYEDANRVYARIAPQSPFSLAAALAMARNLDRLDRFEEGSAKLRALAKVRVDDPEPLGVLGDMLRRRDRFEEAVTAYDKAFERIETLENHHWRLLYARGIALERSKNWARAEKDFLKALEFEPEQPFVLNYLGYSWVEQGRHLEEAEDMIRRAVAQRPNDGYIVDSLGWVLFRLGRAEEAVEHMERAVELRPEDPVINDHLGDVYWVVGRQREARYQWQAALSLDPEPELRAAIESKLRTGLIQEATAEPP